MNSSHDTRPPASNAPRWVRFNAMAVVDGVGFSATPGSVLLSIRGQGGCRWRGQNGLVSPGGWSVVHLECSGTAQEVDRHPLSVSAEVVGLPDSVLIPGLVNAHTHLDLTAIGPRPFDAARGFMGFVDTVRSERPTDETGVAAAVARGVELSLAGGVVAVGDIAGAAMGRPRLWATDALRRSPLMGTSFVEFFAMGSASEDRLASTLAEVTQRLESESRTGESRVRIGLSPHAPYSVGPRGYQAALELASRFGTPLCTHLAETIEERRFVARGEGPFVEFLTALGLWDEQAKRGVGKGRSPVQHLLKGSEFSATSRTIAAVHVNDCDSADEAMLVGSGCPVIYCPRASDYFGAPERFGPHRWRSLLRTGVTVGLGTDSIINLPAAAARIETGGMSVLHEMRLLHSRAGDERAEPGAVELLAMGTMHGARAIGLNPSAFRLSGGTAGGGLLAGLVCVNVAAADRSKGPAHAVLTSDAQPELLVLGTPGHPEE